MSFDIWIIYLLSAVIATATPGPAIFLIMTNSIKFGWRKTIYMAIGNIIALLIMSIITISGLGFILKTSEILFSLIKYLGAFYLIYMGTKLFFQKDSITDLEQSDSTSKNTSSFKLFIQAFTVAVSNPKAILFLNALFPQFINIKYPLFSQFVILITTLMSLSFTFLMTYSMIAFRTKQWLNKKKRLIFFNRASGILFVGLGIILGSSTNK